MPLRKVHIRVGNSLYGRMSMGGIETFLISVLETPSLLVWRRARLGVSCFPDTTNCIMMRSVPYSPVGNKGAR